MEGVIEYVWMGEIILRCSEEFVNEDNGTLIAALLEEQTTAAKWGGVASPTVMLFNPPLYEIL